jgi:hypothetical protein
MAEAAQSKIKALDQLSNEELLALSKSAPANTQQGLNSISNEELLALAKAQPLEAMQAPQPKTMMQNIGMGTRDVIEGLSQLPALAYDVAALPFQAARAGYNALTGSQGGYIPSGQSQVKSGLDAMGLPKAETEDEQLMSALRRGASSAVTPVAAARTLASSVTSPMAKYITSQFAASPVPQVIGSATGETAVEAAKQYGADPLAQAGIGLVAGTTAGLGASATGKTLATMLKNIKDEGVTSAFKGEASTVPTRDSLAAQSNAAYKAADDAGVVFKDTGYKDFVLDVSSAAKTAGIDKTIHPNASAALTRLVDEVGKNPTLGELEILRRVVKGAAGSKEPDERRIAQIMVKKLDEYVTGAGQNEILAGSKEGVDSLGQARALWTKVSKSDVIDDLLERSELKSSFFTGSGKENALRSEFRTLALDKDKMRMFTKDEQDAIKAVSQGSPVSNTLRLFGKLAPTGVVSAGGGSGLGYLLGDAAGSAAIGALAVPAVGAAARYGATKMTESAAQRASDLMRSGVMANKNPQELAKILATQEMLRTYNRNQ